MRLNRGHSHGDKLSTQGWACASTVPWLAPIAMTRLP